MREFFKVTKIIRKFDRRTGKFVINVAYKTRTEITERTVAVSEAFGLGVDAEKEHVVYDNVELKIGPKDIVYITGDSGSGKSVLLRALEKDLGNKAVNIANLLEGDKGRPLIDTLGQTIEEGLELLSSCIRQNCTQHGLFRLRLWQHLTAKSNRLVDCLWYSDRLSCNLEVETLKCGANLHRIFPIFMFTFTYLSLSQLSFIMLLQSFFIWFATSFLWGCTRSMVDVEYARGWGDCLEAMEKILKNVKTVKEARTKINKLQELVKDKKFEKIKYDLGIFGIF